MHDTPLNIGRKFVSGRLWTVQLLPSHASASGPASASSVESGPTARHASSDTQETSVSRLMVELVPAMVVGCVLSIVQLLPFHDSAKGGALNWFTIPTAAHALDEVHDTP